MKINNINYTNYTNYTFANKQITNSNAQTKVSNPQYKSIDKLTHFYMPVFKASKYADRQLKNILTSAKEINYTDSITDGEKKLLEKFFAGDKTVKIKDIIGSNGTTYIVSDTTSDTKIVLKSQHKAIDGKAEGQVTRTDSKDFKNEVEKLKQIPESINSTKMLAEIKLTKNNDERDLIVLSFIAGEKLSEAGNDFLNKENLSKFYDDLFELDKKQIFHRDLNAFNVMASNNQLYIIDYGSAKSFDEMDKLSLKAKLLFEAKTTEEKEDAEKTLLQKLATEALKDEATREKEAEEKRVRNKELISNIKYRRYDKLALSNLENFETLGLMPYLKIHSDSSEKTSKDELNSTDRLFLEHLKLKGEYYKKRIEYFSGKNLLSKEELENERILAKQLSLIDTENLSEIGKDIANVELLRMKMLNSQKAARLYIANDTKNYKMALYWNMDLGITSKFAMYEISRLQSEYTGNDDMLKYLKLNLDFAKFYNREIFPEVYSAASTEASQAITNTTSMDMTSIRATMNDGCWLDSSKRAPSNYIPDTPHKFNCFQF